MPTHVPTVTRHTGPWSDTSHGAFWAVLAAVNVDVGNYVDCGYMTEAGFLAPVNPTGEWEIHYQYSFSQARQQWRCTVQRLPHIDREDLL